MTQSTAPIGPAQVPSAPPSGYHYETNVTPALTAKAAAILKENYPLGKTIFFYSGGKAYLARIEPHAPDINRGITEWHPGVTVYVKNNDDLAAKAIDVVEKPNFIGATGGAVVGTMVAGPGLGTVIGGAIGYIASKFLNK